MPMFFRGKQCIYWVGTMVGGARTSLDSLGFHSADWNDLPRLSRCCHIHLLNPRCNHTTLHHTTPHHTTTLTTTEMKRCPEYDQGYELYQNDHKLAVASSKVIFTIEPCPCSEINRQDDPVAVVVVAEKENTWNLRHDAEDVVVEVVRSRPTPVSASAETVVTKKSVTPNTNVSLSKNNVSPSKNESPRKVPSPRTTAEKTPAKPTTTPAIIQRISPADTSAVKAMLDMISPTEVPATLATASSMVATPTVVVEAEHARTAKSSARKSTPHATPTGRKSIPRSPVFIATFDTQALTIDGLFPGEDDEEAQEGEVEQEVEQEVEGLEEEQEEEQDEQREEEQEDQEQASLACQESTQQHSTQLFLGSEQDATQYATTQLPDTLYASTQLQLSPDLADAGTPLASPANKSLIAGRKRKVDHGEGLSSPIEMLSKFLSS